MYKTLSAFLFFPAKRPEYFSRTVWTKSEVFKDLLSGEKKKTQHLSESLLSYDVPTQDLTALLGREQLKQAEFTFVS